MIPEILLHVPDMTLKKQSLIQVAGKRKQTQIPVIIPIVYNKGEIYYESEYSLLSLEFVVSGSFITFLHVYRKPLRNFVFPCTKHFWLLGKYQRLLL